MLSHRPSSGEEGRLWCKGRRPLILLPMLRDRRGSLLPISEAQMKPRTDDERHLVLTRLIRDLGRLRTDAGDLRLTFLAFILANAQDEARDQLEGMETGEN